MILIDKSITSRILMVGVDASDNAKGGMASVVQSYKKYFETINYICTWKDKSDVIKIVIYIYALLLYVVKLTINRKIKVVHIHSTIDVSFRRKRLFVKIAKLYKKKILFHMHGGAFPDYYNNQSSKKKISILKILNSVDEIAVIVEDPWLQWFTNIGIPREKIIVLNNTIDIPIKNIKSSNNRKIHMIYMGKLLPEKGIYDLLEVFRDHKDELYGKVILRVAGFFEEERLIDTINEYEIHDIVSFEGFLSGTEKINLLNWGDILVQPSYFEAQSISILEAMSYGLAILASNVGGIPSIVKNEFNGLLFSPGNKHEIWGAIKYLINNPSKMSFFGNNGTKMVMDYLPEKTMEQLRNTYKNLLLSE